MTDLIEIHPGVMRQLDHRQAVYTGTAEALIAAGLVELGQLPGQPGNGRGMCTYDPSGDKVAKGCPHGRGAPGRKYIVAKKTAQGSVFEIRLSLSPERVEALEAMRVRETACWPFPVVIGHTVSVKGLDRQTVYQASEVCA